MICDTSKANFTSKKHPFPPNNRTEMRQTTERKYAKQPNGNAPNNRMKMRQITELSIFLFIFAPET